MKTFGLLAPALVAACVVATAATAAEPSDLPDRAAAAAVLSAYLADHGDFCLGKTAWPVDISALDERSHGRDVAQMPVLQSLGLVRSGPATAMRVEGPGAEEGAPPVPVAVTRYELTPLGERFMREREVPVARAEGDVRVRERDLCAAHLALAEVVAVAPGAGPRGFVATYTFEARPAPWATAPEFQRAFPMAARVIDGSRRMQLKQSFQWGGRGWEPAGLAN